MDVTLVTKRTKGIVGISRYTEELAKRLHARVITLHSRMPRLFIDWEAIFTNYPLKLPRVKGIMHLTSQTLALPLLWQKHKGPIIVSVLDVIPLAIQFKDRSLIDRILFKLTCIAIKRADHIITISEHTKKDVMRYLRIPEKKITVTPLAADLTPKKVARSTHTMLYVGSLDPRKNIEVILRALRFVPDVRLRMVGHPQFNRQHEIERAASALGVAQQLDWIGPVEDIAKEYAKATICVMPSRYEGFGLTVIEAMACSCPVLAANTSSLPEVGGDAALYFNPDDHQALASLIKKVINSPRLQKELQKRGKKRAKLFTWENTATLTRAVYARFD